MTLINKTINLKNVISATDDLGTIEGYASVFNEVDQAGDTILPTAFDNIISKGVMPAMFFDHQHYDLPIGKWTDLAVDSHGLKVKGVLDLNDTQAQKIYDKIKFGAINGLSIGFTVSKNDYEVQANTRVIKNINSLFEISIVSLPCEQLAQINSVKSINEIDTIRDFEKCLRDLGISKNNALALCSRAKAIFGDQRDFENERSSTFDNELKAIAEKLKTLNNQFSKD